MSRSLLGAMRRLLVLALWLVVMPPALADTRKSGDIEMRPAQLTTADGKTLAYELGTLYVPENRSRADSRLIGVGFARFAALKPTKTPPIFLLPGGPGYSYLETLRLDPKNPQSQERLLAAIARYRQIADLVLVDQRGHSLQGEGQVLTFKFTRTAEPLDQPGSAEHSVQRFVDESRATQAQFADGRIDLAGYTVIECADDVEALRRALGYRQITLNGSSYGSQWSFAVMRRHPQSVARALLSGVEPLDHGFDMPSHVYAAFQRVWWDVERDPRFAPYLPPGGFGAVALAVRERLEKAPLQVVVKDEKTGERVSVVLGKDDFYDLDPEPLLALYYGHYEKWARDVVNGRRGGGGQEDILLPILIDTSLSVTPARRERLWWDPAVRYLGRGNFAGYLAAADIWPSPDVGDDLRTPVPSDIPVLFAQGDWDTSTPVENTLEIAPYFRNGHVLIAERGGHGVIDPIARQLPDTWAAIVEFLRSGDRSGLPSRVRLQPAYTFDPPDFPPPAHVHPPTP